MAISFPAPEAVRTDHIERVEGVGADRSWLVAGAGRLLRGCYQRACSAIFDAPGDCMRF